MAQRKNKIQLKKRSRPAAQLHKGFSMPVGPGSDNSLVSFRDFADLKAKYFRFSGRLGRRPFLFRTVILIIAQFMFSTILYLKLAEALWIGRLDFAALFGILFVALTIPVVWAQLSLGMRRCHDLNKPGAVFLIPFAFYLASYVCIAVGVSDTVTLAIQSVMTILYIALYVIKGTDGDNAYGPARP